MAVRGQNAGTVFQRQYVFLGTTAQGERVLMSGEIRVQPGEWETTEHATVSGPVTLSLTSAVFTGKKNIDQNHVTSGATLEHLGKIVTPAPGYTLAQVRELHRIGTDWHLNTMHSACAHMTLPEDTSYDVRKFITCPVTGYQYGQSWLTQVLPEEIEHRFVELMNIGRQEDADY